MNNDEIVLEIGKMAESYYRDGDFFCSEAVVKAVLEGVGETPSHETIAMASGFPAGVGGTGCICGALSGGVMAIGYFFGRSQAGSPDVATAMSLSAELQRKFVARHKVTCCRSLTRGTEAGSAERKDKCVAFTGEVARDVAAMIFEKR